VRKYIDLKNKITSSNYLLGKVFILLLSALIFVLIYKNSFHSFNFYSALAVLFLISAVGYKAFNYINAGFQSGSLIDRLEFPLLLTLLFEVVIEIFGYDLFPLSYAMVPVLTFFFGLAGGGLAFFVIAFLRLTQPEGEGLAIQMSLLIFSTAAFGYLLQRGKMRFNNYSIHRSKGREVILPGLMSGYSDQEINEEPLSVKELKEDIGGSLKILDQLVPNHSIVLYMKMDDGLYAIADFLSESEDNVDRGQRLNFRTGYLGWVLKTKTQVSITSIKNVRKNLIYYTKYLPVKSLLATPLSIQKEEDSNEAAQDIFGMLVIDSLERDAFGEKEKLIVSLISDRIIELIERFQLSEKVNLSSQELSSFYDFTQKLNATSDVDIILDHINDTLVKLFDADFVAISLTDGEDEYSCLRRVSGGIQEHLEGKEIPHLNTLIGLVCESGKHFHFEDLSAREKYKQVFGKEIDFALGMNNIKSILIYPFYETYPDVENQEQNVLGCVVIGRKTKYPFNEGEIGLAKIICHESAKSMTASLNFQKVKELAIKDGLTGIYNHRHFQEMLSHSIAHAERYSDHASLLLIDMDDLKMINDTYGHRMGDAALSAIGNLLTESLRKVDIPARYGGDEFAVVLPRTNKAGSIEVAQKIRDRVERISLKSDGVEIEISISIGISTYPESGTDKETLVEKADRALYESKNQGKNKLTHYEDISLEELGS